MTKTDNRITRDALLAEFPGDDSILMDLEGRRYHRINETGAFIWKSLEEGKDDTEIVAALERDFEVSREKAESSVGRFIGDLVSRGLVRADSTTPR